jgi:hypothetical protein
VRLRGRQARFLLITLGGWAGARAWMLWPAAVSLPVAQVAVVGRAPNFVESPARPEPVEGPSVAVAHVAKRRAGLRQAQPERRGVVERSLQPSEPILIANSTAVKAAALPQAAKDHPPDPSNPLLPTPKPTTRNWEAQAYLYVRPSSVAAALAAGGQLGGSQIAARIGWRPNGGPIGLAVRAYAPLGQKGAEAAAGVDWYPFRKVALRVSAERRQRLDRFGRSAWSAYAAGGFYRGGAPGHLEVDGYAQAGVVGTQRRDLFVDGAWRVGYRLPVARVAPIVGAAIWGAAQPGVSRIDVGPRAALRVPVANHMLTFALDGRFRVTGDAAPGSGAAFTLATDF